MNRSKHILEKRLPSGIYCTLLEHKSPNPYCDLPEPKKYKKGISQRHVAREYYEEKNFKTANRVYSIMKEFANLGLVTRRKKPRDNKNTIYVKPNIRAFLMVLSERRLPQNIQLDDLDIERLEELFSAYNGSIYHDISDKVETLLTSDINKTKFSFRINVLDEVAFILKVGSFIINTNLEFKEKLSLLSKTLGKPFDKILYLFEPFEKLPLDLRTKLGSLEVLGFDNINLQTILDLMKAAEYRTDNI